MVLESRMESRVIALALVQKSPSWGVYWKNHVVCTRLKKIQEKRTGLMFLARGIAFVLVDKRLGLCCSL